MRKPKYLLKITLAKITLTFGLTLNKNGMKMKLKYELQLVKRTMMP